MDIACRDYSRSLINNLSLASGYVLVPTETELQQVCAQLEALQALGLDLGSIRTMRALIKGGLPRKILRSKAYSNLELLIRSIQKLEPDLDLDVQSGGSEPPYFPTVVQLGGNIYNSENGRIY